MLGLAAVCCLCGCGKGEKAAAADNAELSADSMAVVCYTLQAQGHFSEYVNVMQSAKDMPDDYKQRTALSVCSAVQLAALSALSEFP